TMVEMLTASPGAAIAAAASVTPETVSASEPAHVTSDPELQPPRTPSACIPTACTPAAIGPKFCTPVPCPGASAPEVNCSTPSTSRWAMMEEQWVVAASNWTRSTPSVGSATVGTGVQSCGVMAASQPSTPTAKLRVRSAAEAPDAQKAQATASAAST